MAIIFLVPVEISENYAFVGETKYFFNKKGYREIPEYQDGATPVEESIFCGYCHSNRCEALFGDSLCWEKD